MNLGEQLNNEDCQSSGESSGENSVKILENSEIVEFTTEIESGIKEEMILIYYNHNVNSIDSSQIEWLDQPIQEAESNQLQVSCAF